MASRHEVAEYPQPWFGELPPPEDWRVAYDDEGDSLHIHFGAPRAAVSFDVAPGVWLRSEPRTGEVVGVEIEDYRGFSDAHRDFCVAGATVATARAIVRWLHDTPSPVNRT